ncbi:MAG: hypothetical protein JWN67_5037 [Actinomycetia bacterium]|nr:hypothetical protein [Actinomycetes bacterium]
MAAAPVEILPHDLAVIEALETIGCPVGFAEAPEGAVEALTTTTGGPDYVVLYPLPSQRMASSIDDSVGDVALVYQTTIVARLPEGARYLIDKIEAALYTVAVPNRAVVRITPDDVGDVRPDNDLQLLNSGGPVFIATPRWRLWTSRA